MGFARIGAHISDSHAVKSGIKSWKVGRGELFFHNSKSEEAPHKGFLKVWLFKLHYSPLRKKALSEPVLCR